MQTTEPSALTAIRPIVVAIENQPLRAPDGRTSAGSPPASTTVMTPPAAVEAKLALTST
jgi:hypothetical protein